MHYLFGNGVGVGDGASDVVVAVRDGHILNDVTWMEYV